MRREKSAKMSITRNAIMGLVEWPGLDLTPRPRVWPRVYTEEEICQLKRYSYKKHYYVTHKVACIERARKSTVHKKLIVQQPQAV